MTTTSASAVIWDLGGVFSASPFRALATFAESEGIDADTYQRTVFGPFDTDTADHPWHRLERGEIAMSEALDEIRNNLKAVGIQADPFGWFGAIRPDTYDAAPLVELATELHERGISQAILTNNVAEFRGKWERLVPIEVFGAVIDSHEVGVRKPDPKTTTSRSMRSASQLQMRCLSTTSPPTSPRQNPLDFTASLPGPTHWSPESPSMPWSGSDRKAPADDFGLRFADCDVPVFGLHTVPVGRKSLDDSADSRGVGGTTKRLAEELLRVRDGDVVDDGDAGAVARGHQQLNVVLLEYFGAATGHEPLEGWVAIDEDVAGVGSSGKTGGHEGSDSQQQHEPDNNLLAQRHVSSLPSPRGLRGVEHPQDAVTPISSHLR